MTEKKKREKVVAEVTSTHVAEIAAETGLTLSSEEVLAFLNYEGRAYEMWKRMMQAGEEYITATLQKESKYQQAPAPVAIRRMAV